MTKTFAIAAMLAVAPLAACNNSPEEAQEDLAEQQLESQADIAEDKADVAEAAGNEQMADQMEERSDALNEASDNVEMNAEDSTGM